MVWSHRPSAGKSAAGIKAADPDIVRINAALHELREELRKKRERYADAHPGVVRLEKEITASEAELAKLRAGHEK